MLEFIDNFLICLTGLPASGKTTFAKKLKSIIIKEQDKFGVEIIDPDVIRSAIIEGSFDPEKEELVRIKNLNKIEHNLRKNKIVISDDINYYTSMRHELKAITHKIGCNFFIIHISTPLEVCLKWNKKRGKPIPDDVILKIAEKFDMFEKYKWESPDLVVDMSEIIDLNQIIKNFLKQVTQDLEKSSQIKDKSKEKKASKKKYHELLDTLTRSIAGNALKHKQFQENKNEILNKRKEFIQNNLNKKLTKKEIKQKFKEFLKKTLNIEGI